MNGYGISILSKPEGCQPPGIVNAEIISAIAPSLVVRRAQCPSGSYICTSVHLAATGTEKVLVSCLESGRIEFSFLLRPTP